MMVLVFADRATTADVEFARTLSGFTDHDDEDDEPLAVSPERGAAKGVAGMTRIARGTWVEDLNLGPAWGVRIYLLALAPNAARLQIRFFLHDTLGEYVERLQRHCRDILFTDPATADHVPSFWHLVRELFPRGADGKPRQDDSTKAKLNKLVGDLGRAVLAGHGYPQSLLPLVLDRLRSDGAFTPNRIGLIKAVLNSEYRRRAGETREIPMSVDESIDDIGYVLGRLFAVLENMQEVSRGRQGRDQPTIRDRFAGAASTTPGTVFPYLLDLEKAHERKAKREHAGLAYSLARKIAELVAKIDGAAGFPRQMDPHQQGLFYIGYYHERQSRFARSEVDADDDQQSTSEE